MRSLAGSLADGVLADAILIPPRPPIPPTNIRRVSGHKKSTETKNILVGRGGILMESVSEPSPMEPAKTSF